ncbi:MAG TPA: multidrug efflux RND transporter permease subunit [Cellvibrio sp.]|nr:multidrug efflux RND transporter permease subunit [Cellvibrio sp.]
MRFTDMFIRRPVLAVTVSLLILLLGTQALFKMQVRQYPELTNTVITVTTAYYGASADLIQGFVTQPLQQAVAEVENINFVQSQSMQGISTVTVHMQLDSDPDAALAATLAKVNSVRATLPADVQDPVITRSTGSTTSIVYLSFSSDKLNASQITDYLNRVVQPQLVTIPGVAKANLMGGSAFAMRIWLDPQRMSALNLSAREVLGALRANNYQAAPGEIKSDWFLYSVDVQTSLTSVEEFSSLIVATRDNGVVRLRDIATVEMAAGRVSLSATADGKEAVLIGIDPTPKGNPLDIAHAVREKLPELQRNMPDTIEMKLLYDATLVIEESIYEVVKTIAEAVIIVVVVIFLFMGSLRAVLIPVVTIPLSLVGVAMLMQLMGFSINLLTLLAMVLAIGLVVDDAIVVVENVDRYLKMGETPFRAAIIGTREIAVPVITMTITLAAVYAPIALLDGLTGALLREFALTLAGAVFISGIVALTLSPMMSSKLLRHTNQDNNFEAKVHRVLDKLDQKYSGMLDAVLAKRPVFVVFALIVLGSLPFLFNIITNELAPAEDNGVVFVMATAPDNANLDYIETHMAKASAMATKEPEVVTALTISGVPASNQGLAIAPMVPWSQREASDQDLLKRLSPPIQSMPGVSATPFALPPLPGASSGLPVQFVITSPGDYPTLYAVAQEVQAAAKASGLFIFSMLDLNFSAANINVSINREKAGAYGVTMEEIGSTLALLMGDGYVNRINIESRSYEVIPQVERIDRLTPESIGEYHVMSATGTPVPLKNLIDFDLTGKPRSLPQYNQVNAVTMSAVLFPGTGMGEAVAFLQAQAEKSLPKGFSYDFLGESRQYVEEGSALYMTFLLALLIIYLVLAAQFESLRDPLVILVSVPMAVCGALLMLGFGLASMNIYTQVGLITLVGLISKHGILMCEVAKEQQLHHGLDRFEAIRLAARIRLRPILMTTAAMVAGLIPLLLATGAGAMSRYSIGLVLVAGLSIGTLFTLFVLPVVYTFLASSHKPLQVFDENAPHTESH